MTKVGELIFVRGRPEVVTEVEMIYRDGKSFYVAIRSESIKPEEIESAGASAPRHDAVASAAHLTLLKKEGTTMKRTIAALAFALPLAITAPAYAETVIGLGAGVCNGALTVCSIPNDAGDVIAFSYDSTVSSTVTVVVTDAVGTTTYTGPIVYGTPTVNTLYRRVTPFTVDLSPSAELSGDYVLTRSGSGRGGWAWHRHWDFHLLTIQ